MSKTTRRDAAAATGNAAMGRRAAFPERLRLRVPAACPRCGVAGRVHLESTLQGSTATPHWCCGACGFEWNVSVDGDIQIDRRGNVTDRRRSTRTDRRVADTPKRSTR